MCSLRRTLPPFLPKFWSITCSLAITCVAWSRAFSVEASKDPVKDEPPITQTDREFWAFRPLVRPALPAVLNSKSVRNPIDHFVQTRLETAGRSLAPSASPTVLIRRVTFDLTGLPPSPDEVRAFESACQAASADSALPDPLEALADRLLASPRYGEKWAGHWLDLARFAESDGFEHDAERKQAWKYRDWVIESLNNDLSLNDFVAMQIAGDEISPQHEAATGFLLAGPDMPDSNFQDERRHLLLNDITATVGSAFLGLTIGCAQCHNHPFDPISQADFYRLRAFFDNLIPLKKDQQLPSAMTEPGPVPRQSHVAIRGDHQRSGPVVQPAYPRIADEQEAGLGFASLPKSSGRRMALARWITRPDNRLFLRATANRFWQFHFGEALAATPNDLGHQGSAPTDANLLDWLACEIPSQKWSLKALHKLIVTSATYGQRSGNELQPTSQYTPLARRRLTGEELRDALLFSSGKLELRSNGPSTRVAPVSASSKPGTKPEPDANCRSIWIFAKRNEPHPLLELFDRPDALLSCSRRNQSTTAPQALTLFNSEFSHTIAQALASRLLQSSNDPIALVTAANWQCFSRSPTPTEQSLGEKFLSEHAKFTADLQESLTDYCLALINSNAFCFVD